MGAHQAIRVGILTSSRADFGIYLPLLKEMDRRKDAIVYELIVFGTHLSPFHGYTVDEIRKLGYTVYHEMFTVLASDTPAAIASSFGLSVLKFSDFWQSNRYRYRYVVCLGDRFEMAAAVMAGLPYGIKFAHLHGGETTLGAIDNVYRHTITLASYVHFVSIAPYKERVLDICGIDTRCFVAGALSLDSLKEIRLLSQKEFEKIWGIDLTRSSVLITVHPETIAFENNETYAAELYQALKELVKSYQLIITLPNADTFGIVFRKTFEKINLEYVGRIFLIENFGTQSYFTCMSFVDHMIGNSSSGIIEAASFGKYVVNVGDRQKGRETSSNVLHVPFLKDEIIRASEKVRGKIYQGDNIYDMGGAASLIVDELINLA